MDSFFFVWLAVLGVLSFIATLIVAYLLPGPPPPPNPPPLSWHRVTLPIGISVSTDGTESADQVRRRFGYFRPLEDDGRCCFRCGRTGLPGALEDGWWMTETDCGCEWSAPAAKEPSKKPRRIDCIGCGAPLELGKANCSWCARPVS